MISLATISCGPWGMNYMGALGKLSGTAVSLNLQPK